MSDATAWMARLPAKLEKKLPKRSKNVEYALVDDDIVLIDKDSKTIIDVIEGLGKSQR